MNRFPTRADVERMKAMYPKGTKIELIEMNDPYRDMPAGLTGEVTGVDDMGTVHAVWSNGTTLGAVFGEDRIRKISE